MLANHELVLTSIPYGTRDEAELFPTAKNWCMRVNASADHSAQSTCRGSRLIVIARVWTTPIFPSRHSIRNARFSFAGSTSMVTWSYWLCVALIAAMTDLHAS